MARRRPEVWEAVVAAYERSGWTQREFAERRGLSLATLQSWIYRARRGAQDPPRLVPVRVVASPAPKARVAERSEVIEAALPSGLLLRFPIGTDCTYLARLLAALR